MPGALSRHPGISYHLEDMPADLLTGTCLRLSPSGHLKPAVKLPDSSSPGVREALRILAEHEAAGLFALLTLPQGEDLSPDLAWWKDFASRPLADRCRKPSVDPGDRELCTPPDLRLPGYDRGKNRCADGNKIRAGSWEVIRKCCAGKITSLLELLSGKLAGGVMEIVTDRKSGLFPKPEEITLDCSCPDWATMCKHVAAVLYGVGARLDEKPETRPEEGRQALNSNI